jgi:hypothetical protein
MDREAAVLRAEMSRTRADLDQKLSMLQEKVTDLSPRRLTQRYVPDYFAERVVGTLLTMAGLKMAWSRYRALKQRRAHRDSEYREFGYARWQ